jgi:hypothetical protein
MKGTDIRKDRIWGCRGVTGRVVAKGDHINAVMKRNSKWTL